MEKQKDSAEKIRKKPKAPTSALQKGKKAESTTIGQSWKTY
jgi:hypothetical protein